MVRDVLSRSVEQNETLINVDEGHHYAWNLKKKHILKKCIPTKYFFNVKVSVRNEIFITREDLVSVLIKKTYTAANRLIFYIFNFSPAGPY